MKVITILLFFMLHQVGSAQNKIISGNGKITSIQKVLPSFDKLYIDVYCDVHDAVIEYAGEPVKINLKGRAVEEGPGLIRVHNDAEPEGEPVQKKKSPVLQLQYVEVKIKNNSLVRRHFIINGPNESGRSFSYGFPMMPLAKRTKKVPVGTQIFLQKKGLKDKELITITSSDDGKVLDLFSK